jgi:hypothetical protein
MSQINAGKLYIVYLDLTPHDIANLKLNDKIYLDRSYWNINKVIDYDANSNEPTKVELLSIDDELILPRIVRKIDEKPNSSSSLIKPFIQDVLGDINGSLTINASTGNIVLNGKGNVIDWVVSNAVVIGDNQVVTKNGITTNVANVNENFANADLTFTDNRTHDLDGNSMLLTNGIIGFDSIGLSTTGVSISGDQTDPSQSTIVLENILGGQALVLNDGLIRLIYTPTYADEAAATTAGLLNGTIYKTATGELRIKL